MVYDNLVVKLLYSTFFKTEFPTFFHGGNHKINFISIGTPTCENENKTQRQFVEHGDYFSIVDCWTKIPAISRDMNFSRCFLNFYSFIPRFLAEHLTMLCCTVIFRGTLVGKTALD
jgi:hypothetical protein